ncbi:hypothetical protein [Staphylococcus aureus]|uniref:hypothetical protein n=1 Tax=Staphylococcus aureus TaxID=1280 RepID=UPI0020C12106|nr:hypothetical protein [Staphylococcus aureus]
MTLHLRETGLIRDDTYAGGLPSGYVSSPAGRVLLDSGNLRLDHDNNEDTRVLAPISGACAVEVLADYTPTEQNDNGGLVLFAASDSVVEFLEKPDASVTTNVSRWKTRSLNGKDWDLFADSGTGYSFVDTAAEFVPTKVGAVLKKGTGAGFVPLKLQRITITKSDVLSIGNLSAGLTVELLDASNAVVASVTTTSNTATLNMPSLVVTGKLRIKNGATVTMEVSATFYGGDRYDSGSTLKIVLDNVTKPELSTTTLTDIGLMASGQLVKKLYIYNPGGAPVNSVTLTVVQWAAKFGYQWVDVALDVSGAPGTYGDVISYTSIAAGAVIPFWIRVTQGNDYDGFEALQYALDLAHV